MRIVAVRSILAPAHLIPVRRSCVLDQPAPVLLVATADDCIHIKFGVTSPRHLQLLDTTQLHSIRMKRTGKCVARGLARICVAGARGGRRGDAYCLPAPAAGSTPANCTSKT
jgi:hypothetical protein